MLPFPPTRIPLSFSTVVQLGFASFRYAAFIVGRLGSLISMRIWSLHPRYLDSKGLVACWREVLLARHVLLGLTKGYTQHPQLVRFRAAPRPVEAIDAYLTSLYDEATRRNYKFDPTKFVVTGVQRRCENAEGLPKKRARKQLSGSKRVREDATAPQVTHDGASVPSVSVTSGQIAFEVEHLLGKLKVRDPARHAAVLAELALRAEALPKTSSRKRPPSLSKVGLDPHPLFEVTEGGVEEWERP